VKKNPRRGRRAPYRRNPERHGFAKLKADLAATLKGYREVLPDANGPALGIVNAYFSHQEAGRPFGSADIKKKILEYMEVELMSRMRDDDRGPTPSPTKRMLHALPDMIHDVRYTIASSLPGARLANPKRGRRAAQARRRIKSRVGRVWRQVRSHAGSFGTYTSFGRRAMKTLKLAGRVKRCNPRRGRRAAQARCRVVARTTLRARINKASGGARNAVMRSIIAQVMAGKVKVRGARISAAVNRGIRRGRR
jgi:hypothetical protein